MISNAEVKEFPLHSILNVGYKLNEDLSPPQSVDMFQLQKRLIRDCSSEVDSIGMALAFCARGCEFESRQIRCFREIECP